MIEVVRLEFQTNIKTQISELLSSVSSDKLYSLERFYIIKNEIKS